MDVPCQIRLAAASDVPAIAGIERAVFSDPWPQSAFLELLGESSWIAEADAGLVGYLFARAAADEAEILNLAVREDHRRRGIGRCLLETALGDFWRVGVRTVYLEVRESNEAGQTFYQALGFREVGRRRSYYQKPCEDALILARGTGPLRGPA